MKAKKRKPTKQEKQRILSFFLIMFPTLVVIILGRLSPEAWAVSILIAFWQMVMVKQFIDEYYSIG